MPRPRSYWVDEPLIRLATSLGPLCADGPFTLHAADGRFHVPHREFLSQRSRAPRRRRRALSAARRVRIRRPPRSGAFAIGGRFPEFLFPCEGLALPR